MSNSVKDTDLYPDSQIQTRDLVLRYFLELESEGREPTNAEISRLIARRAGRRPSATTISESVREIRRARHFKTSVDLQVQGVPDEFKQEAGELLAALIGKCQTITDTRVKARADEVEKLLAVKDQELREATGQRDAARLEAQAVTQKLRVAEDFTGALKTRTSELETELAQSYALQSKLKLDAGEIETKLRREIAELESRLAGTEERLRQQAQQAHETLEAEKHRASAQLLALKQSTDDALEAERARHHVELLTERDKTRAALDALSDFKTFVAETTARERDELARVRAELEAQVKAAEQRTLLAEAKASRFGDDLRAAIVDAQKWKTKAEVLEQEMQRMNVQPVSPALQHPSPVVAQLMSAIEVDWLDTESRALLKEIVSQVAAERPGRIRDLEKKIAFLLSRPKSDAQRVKLLIAALAQNDPHIMDMSTKGWG